MAKYILSLDQGTTSSRAILFDKQSNIINIQQQEFNQIFPRDGFVEHNANVIFDTQASVAKKCVKDANISPSDIAAVGITNQRETTIVWNKKTGEPIYNAIVWQDRRTASFCNKLKDEGKEAMVREKTGLLLDPYFSATKIAWILDNVEGARKLAENGELLFGTVDTWLIWNFTKGKSHVTDPSNASRTLLFNIRESKWDDELLELFNIPRSMLPEVMPSSCKMAQMHPEFLGVSLNISGVAGDQQAATYGNACLKEGMVKNTYGTGCFLLMNTGHKIETSSNNLLTTVAFDTGSGNRYAFEGSVYIGGAVVQWLRDGLKIIQNTSDTEALCSLVPDNGGLYLVPAFTGLGAPYWDPYARGMMIGISRATTQAHIARAALESIAYQSLDIVKAMEKDAKMPMTTLRVDGGASRNNMLMQIQADLLNVVVERPVITETTALGAAYLAGLAVNFWADEQELSSMWKLDRRFEPKMTEDQRQQNIHDWRKAVERSLAWANDK